MKIKNIQYQEYQANLKNIFLNSQTAYSNKKSVIIKIITDKYIGLGEVSPLDGFSKETFKEIIWTLELFIKSIVSDTEYTFKELLSLADIHCSDIPSLHFAVDTAIYDIEGQIRELPISKILNPKCKNINYFSSIYQNNQSLDDIKSKSIKYKLGINNLEEDIKIFKFLKNRQLTLRIDANQNYTLAEFQKIYPLLLDYNIEYFEEPIKNLNKDILYSLKKISIAIDENIYQNHNYKTWIEENLINTIIIKPGIFGGYKKILSLIKLANHNNTNIILSSSLANSIGNMAAIHLAAALNNNLEHGLNIYNFYNTFIAQPIYNKTDISINLNNIRGLGITL